ncbi:MAG: class I SAM-dependent methyltransferase [Phycisphaerae bacterium]|nr:class I SAM-dependent methyltransferase [Phycisphaerae bacterium]
MASSSLWPYRYPAAHETVSDIIRQRSTNATDLREVVLRDFDISFARNILDLGCGFGFMAEALARRAAPGACVVGVDVWPSNEAPFLERVAATGREARFHCMQIGSRLPWPDRSFDLVVCSFSLYFFVDVLPEVARVLAPHGLFLTVTHSDRSFLGLLRAAGLTEAASGLLALMRQFSAENGRSHLERWFGQVTQIDYHNALRFKAAHLDDLLLYLKFKLPLLIPDAAQADNLPSALIHHAEASLSRLGEVVVEKNDTAFQCRSPLCH